MQSKFAVQESRKIDAVTSSRKLGSIFFLFKRCKIDVGKGTESFAFLSLSVRELSANIRQGGGNAPPGPAGLRSKSNQVTKKHYNTRFCMVMCHTCFIGYFANKMQWGHSISNLGHRSIKFRLISGQVQVK